MGKAKVGIVGCGNISGIYLENCTKMFNNLEVAACADLITKRAKAKAEEFGIPRVYSVDELLSDPEISIVINLTVPKTHAEICIRALDAGKNVYVEKPLAVRRQDGLEILKMAGDKGLLVGGAPDTFLGGGLQTCRKLLDDGWIGRPVGATAFMLASGPESWHPNPEFFYKTGGGPMFDMGPYYLTALVSLLGPVKRVTGSAAISFSERTATCREHFGEKIKVEIPTHIAGIMEFENGVTGTIITSFDVKGTELPRIEIYGSEGTLSVPDPNTFGGPVRIRRFNSSDWQEVPLTHGYEKNSRGLGAADMTGALASGRKHRANAGMAYHILDMMHAFHDASREGRHYLLQSTCSRPMPMPMGLIEGEID